MRAQHQDTAQCKNKNKNKQLHLRRTSYKLYAFIDDGKMLFIQNCGMADRKLSQSTHIIKTLGGAAPVTHGSTPNSTSSNPPPIKLFISWVVDADVKTRG